MDLITHVHKLPNQLDRLIEQGTQPRVSRHLFHQSNKKERKRSKSQGKKFFCEVEKEKVAAREK